MVLPFLEEQTVYDLWHFDLDFYDPLHKVPRETFVPVWVCPSRRDGKQPSSERREYRDKGVWGVVGDYAGNFGEVLISDVEAFSKPVGATGVIVQAPGKVSTSGKFTWDGNVRFKHITDGLSNTILVGEKHVPTDAYGQWDGDASLYNGDFLVNHVRAGGESVPIARSVDDKTSCGFNTCTNFGSSHAGICQFVFCDGSVHLLSVDIDLTALRRLTSRADGEVIAGL
jgi:hypothetical protein